MAVEPIKEAIQLTLDSSGIPRNSLAALITQLEQVEAKWKSLDAVINQTNTALARSPRPVAEMQTQLLKAQTLIAGQSKGGKGYSAAAIANVLGFDPAAFTKQLAEARKGVEGYHKTIQQFRNLPSAARYASEFEAAQYKQWQKRSISMRDILRPTVGSVHGTGALKVEGGISLVIPGRDIHASVEGPVNLVIQGSQIVGVGGAPSGGAAGGVVTAADTAGGKGNKKLTKAAAAGAVVVSESKLNRMKGLASAYSENADLITPGSKIISVTRQTSSGAVTTMYGETEKGFVPFKEVTRGKGAQMSPEQMRREMLRASVLHEKQQAAEQLRAEAARDTARLGGLSGSGVLIEGQAALATEDARINATLEKRRRRAAEQEDARARRAGGGTPSQPKPTMVQKAMQQSFSMEGMAAHTIKVAGWAMAAIPIYAAAYKPFELAAYSMQRMLDVGMQMGHLQVIFKQQGGSVKQLTDDIIGLAAAQGRSSDEAMESATEWARLGLTRTQVNQAVAASMMAANVAQMHTTETTKQLMSLLHIYHMQVGDLNSELGKLVYTSQHYNVTLEDLFRGLDAAGPQARAMGMSLADLQGIIAGTVGKTGQSGVVVGNTVKYILQQFNRPQMQAMLRGYGVEATTSEGAIKKAPQILRELFVQYQGMNTTERQSMTTQLAGRFHGARFTGMMDSYIESQKLAIDSQLNLNAAQTANAAILDTLQNKLQGLKAEWDRFVYGQATTPSAALGGFTPMQLMTGMVGGTTNAMRGLDQAHQSLLTPLAGAGLLGGSMAGKAILTKLIAKDAEKAGSSMLLNAGRSVGKSFLPRVLMELGGALGLGRLASFALGPEVGIPLMIATAMPKVGTMLGAQTAGGELDAGSWNRGDQWAKLAQKYGGTSAAAAGKADLYRTTLDLLGLKNTDTVARKNLQAAIAASASEMDKTSGAALTGAFAGGDTASARKVLEDQRKAEQAREKTETAKKLYSEHQTITLIQQQASELQARLNEPYVKGGRPVYYGPESNMPGIVDDAAGLTKQQGFSPAEAKIKQAKLDDLNKQIADAQAEKSQIQEGMEEEEGAAQEEFLRKKEYLALLEQQKGLMQDIAQLADLGSTGTPLGKLAAEQQSAAMQADLAKETFERLQTYTNKENHPEAMLATEAARQSAMEAQAKADALNSPRLQAMAELQENREILDRRTDIETRGVGYTDTEKLLNQRANATTDQKATQDPNRALEDSKIIYETNLKLQERMVELKKQEQQIMVDTNREQAKAMLFAGPGELLKRLYVSQVRNRRDPISTGEFMSWSPDMRQMFYESRGGEAGAKNREEQWLLGRNGVNGSYQGELDQRDKDLGGLKQRQSAVAAADAAKLKGLPALPLPGDELSAAGKLATGNITAMGSAAGITTAIVNQLNIALSEFLGITKMAANAAAGKPMITAPSLGISPGWALGAKIAGALF